MLDRDSGVEKSRNPKSTGFLILNTRSPMKTRSAECVSANSGLIGPEPSHIADGHIQASWSLRERRCAWRGRTVSSHHSTTDRPLIRDPVTGRSGDR